MICSPKVIDSGYSGCWFRYIGISPKPLCSDYTILYKGPLQWHIRGAEGYYLLRRYYPIGPYYLVRPVSTVIHCTYAEPQDNVHINSSFSFPFVSLLHLLRWFSSMLCGVWTCWICWICCIRGRGRSRKGRKASMCRSIYTFICIRVGYSYMYVATSSTRISRHKYAALLKYM